MNKSTLITTIGLAVMLGGVVGFASGGKQTNYGAPPYVADDGREIDIEEKYPDLDKWVRPEGPLKVGLQVGHWKSNELPDELEKLRANTGTSNKGVAEWQVNLEIAKAAKKLLEDKGVVVDLLPATIPRGYWADTVVAIHADGSKDRTVRGYKVSMPRRDRSGKAERLEQVMKEVYGKTTGLIWDDNITQNMKGYYAFAWRRFDHSVHPMAPSVILETGFLTNPTEAKMLINNPKLPAGAITDALVKFLGVK